ncbi:hypothetical protein OTU49_000644, partial [Cherax quadricarinatus]
VEKKITMKVNFTRIEVEVWGEQDLPRKMKFAYRRRLFSCFPRPTRHVQGGKIYPSWQVLSFPEWRYGAQEWDDQQQKGLDVSKVRQGDEVCVELASGRKTFGKVKLNLYDIVKNNVEQGITTNFIRFPEGKDLRSATMDYEVVLEVPREESRSFSLFPVRRPYFNSYSLPPVYLPKYVSQNQYTVTLAERQELPREELYFLCNRSSFKVLDKDQQISRVRSKVHEIQGKALKLCGEKDTISVLRRKRFTWEINSLEKYLRGLGHVSQES